MARAVVSELGLDAEIEETEVTSPDDVERLRFLGSPTVQVDGVDIEPAVRSRTDYAMSCRLYTTPDGLPSREMLLTALGAARDDPASEPEQRRCGGECSCASTEASVPRTALRPPGASGSLIATGGSVVAAMLSSACCWVPMLLLAFGASAAGVSAVFGAWRPVFITAAVAMLVVSFYLTFVRRASCCGDAPSRGQRVRRAMWWVSAIVVAAFVFFPQIAGPALSSVSGREPATGASGQEFIFWIDGMHCDTCAVRLDAALSELDGVIKTQTDYASKRARVYAADEKVVPLVLDATRRVGYSATLVRNSP
jgi:copper chaperone CopZ